MQAAEQITTQLEQLPLILAGPMLRHCDTRHFTLWFVSKTRLNTLKLTLTQAQFERPLKAEEVHCVPLGEHAYQYLISISQTALLPTDTRITYQVTDSQHGDLFADLENLTYADQQTPDLVIKPNIDNLLHGSCRNPHHFSDDGLVTADKHLEQHNELAQRPALLMLSGDQVYIDDIAGPTLYAIGQVIELLGLPQEDFVDASIDSSRSLGYQAQDLYQRHRRLLPKTQYDAKTPFWRWYINHPIFTSSMAENHLISLSEIMALYLLTWSPELWDVISIPAQHKDLPAPYQQRWQQEYRHIQRFKAGLHRVRRLMAHLPTYMIFDDHDITDDWNLTAKWEQAAYGHAFSKRIIGNALIGYTLFQGLGNAPDKFTPEIMPLLDDFFSAPSALLQDKLIATLLRFENWHYDLDTQPKLIVLDTRTRRWRSESDLAKPSGLMDWEALMELQQTLIDQTNVIIVSAAPMFGVKLIEIVQRLATYCGASLLVDAENWMAHPGTANSLLNIFMHKKTPQQFMILSGDVHYSFSYDIRLRFRHAGPEIYQITCSGIKNQFPDKLLRFFDRLNNKLYGRYSPLNLLTRRKRLSIRYRRPNQEASQRLVNNSGIGLLALNEQGSPTRIAVLHADNSVTDFHSHKD